MAKTTTPAVETPAEAIEPQADAPEVLAESTDAADGDEPEAETEADEAPANDAGQDARAPWSERLLTMTSDELTTLLTSGLLGERKKAEVRARLQQLS